MIKENQYTYKPNKDMFIVDKEKENVYKINCACILVTRTASISSRIEFDITNANNKEEPGEYIHLDKLVRDYHVPKEVIFELLKLFDKIIDDKMGEDTK